MNFKVVNRYDVDSSTNPSPGVYLEKDKWNDWFEYITMFQFIFFDSSGTITRIGNVKIGQYGMTPKDLSPKIPESFLELDETFFSLGQEETYYDNLKNLGDENRTVILEALRDVVFNKDILKSVLKEHVFQRSLMRDIELNTVRGQFSRIAHGGLKLSKYEFTFTYPKGNHPGNAPVLTFRVSPGSMPPTNVHVLIGRNGVGKTYLLSQMVNALIGTPQKNSGAFNFGLEDTNPFSNTPTRTESDQFSNLVMVSFSAFDDKGVDVKSRSTKDQFRYSYVGLKKAKGQGQTILPKTPSNLAEDFIKSYEKCIVGPRSTRLRSALKTLSSDPIFRDAALIELLDESATKEKLPDKTLGELNQKFDRLSSGHKIVLLTMTKLVETVAEKTLVLFDEPEAHLHPPLLSAFVRAISNLLIDRNGVAIISTHSPVVLQEVPKSCVLKMNRTGSITTFFAPESETFGENVGMLTRDVFGLEVTSSGFHKMLEDSVGPQTTYREVLSHFEGALGNEAKAIAMALANDPLENK
jgi:ABC-type transport system involved in cytochrome c biogenesis ATPase subunit